jgi:hypothetical protein
LSKTQASKKDCPSVGFLVMPVKFKPATYALPTIVILSNQAIVSQILTLMAEIKDYLNNFDWAKYEERVKRCYNKNYLFIKLATLSLMYSFQIQMQNYTLKAFVSIRNLL